MAQILYGPQVQQFMHSALAAAVKAGQAQSNLVKVSQTEFGQADGGQTGERGRPGRRHWRLADELGCRRTALDSEGFGLHGWPAGRQPVRARRALPISHSSVLAEMRSFKAIQAKSR